MLGSRIRGNDRHSLPSPRAKARAQRERRGALLERRLRNVGRFTNLPHAGTNDEPAHGFAPQPRYFSIHFVLDSAQKKECTDLAAKIEMREKLIMYRVPGINAIEHRGWAL